MLPATTTPCTPTALRTYELTAGVADQESLPQTGLRLAGTMATLLLSLGRAGTDTFRCVWCVWCCWRLSTQTPTGATSSTSTLVTCLQCHCVLHARRVAELHMGVWLGAADMQQAARLHWEFFFLSCSRRQPAHTTAQQLGNRRQSRHAAAEHAGVCNCM